MAESWEEYSDGCSVDSYEESPSPSSSSEESANEDDGCKLHFGSVRIKKEEERLPASIDGGSNRQKTTKEEEEAK